MPRTKRDVHENVRAHVHADESVYAALDLGTNNCRLLIAAASSKGDGDPSSFRVLDSFSRIVRLGEGVNETSMLSAEAMDRTFTALKACQKKLSKYTINGKRFVATEACRRAMNGAAFIERVRNELDLHIDIISSEEEARLAFMGCSSLLEPDGKRALVFDIGGGSTELMWVELHPEGKHKITDWLSIGYGVMNLSDTFGGTDFADMVYTDMVSLLSEKMQAFDAANHIRDVVKSGAVQLLSTSGTVTTLAAIHLDLPRYDRSRIDGIKLKLSDVDATTQRLKKMRPSERFNHPCIGADRADFIMSGCAIFEAISNMWPAETIRIADRGVREGIILSLIERQ